MRRYAVGKPRRKPALTTSHVTIHVPGNHLMGPLLGERDELLRMVEASFPVTSIHVRGNEVGIDGDDAERVGRLFGELVTLLTGEDATEALVTEVERALHQEAPHLEVITLAGGQSAYPLLIGVE